MANNPNSAANNQARILIVEDEILLAKDLSMSLKNLGYSVTGRVSSSEDAIRKVEESKPDLILMDIKLEGDADGIEAAGEICSRYDIPVVYLTGFAEKDVLDRAKKTEPYGYLSKPVGLLELRSTIETALYKHEADKRVRESEKLLQRVVHDLQVHQTELETQNEDLRRLQLELEESRSSYRDLYDFAPAGYLTLNEDGSILEANLMASRLLGVEKNALVKTPFPRFVCQRDADAFYLYLQRILENQTEQVCEIRLRSQDGGEFYSKLDGIPAYDTEGQVIGCRVVLSDVSDLKAAHESLTQANERLTQTVREKEVLLREIHHRVKNNLAVISSLLSAQSEYTRDDFHQQMFRDSQSRVRSMALAHELLYQTESLADLRGSEYIGNLVDHLVVSSGILGKAINVKKEMEDVSFSLNTAVPVGYLVTELFSNCLKHAFPDRTDGEIGISLRSVDGNGFELIVKDNGVGMPQGIDLKNPTSLGLDLVDTFVEQLKGEIEIARDEGTEVRIRFKGWGGGRSCPGTGLAYSTGPKERDDAAEGFKRRDCRPS